MTESNTLKIVLTEPQSIEDLHIPQNIVIDLIFRLLHNEGNVALSRFTEVLKIPKAMIDDILLWMQKEHLVEVSKASVELGRLSNVYTLTDAGEGRAQSALERSQYVGPVPVSIPDYFIGIEFQTTKQHDISIEQVKNSIGNLVLPSDFHRQIGPAVNLGASLFLYGPPGNGKTTIALSISKLIAGIDPIWIPYALCAGGQIIQIHDRLVHKASSSEQYRSPKLGRIDQRWTLVERPAVATGGELKMEALDLRFDPVAKFYEAPLQLKANGGLFLIDDFGRQQVSTRDLLNRWIVPLESKIDYLRLLTGQTIIVPFRHMTIFSTNLNPRDLVDDAFLRRIQMKVFVAPPNEKLFYQIFVLEARQRGLQFDKDTFLYLLQKWYREPNRKLQAVHARDLINIVSAICKYDRVPLHLTSELLDDAARIYFID